LPHCGAGKGRSQGVRGKGIVFPAGHPAIPFLLLLAIADDALRLVLRPNGEMTVTANRGRLQYVSKTPVESRGLAGNLEDDEKPGSRWNSNSYRQKSRAITS
jgi:hypothetical protein